MKASEDRPVSIAIPAGEFPASGEPERARLAQFRTAQFLSTVFAERWILLWVWLLLIAVFSALRPTAFFTFGNAQTIFGSQSTLAFVSLAVLFPLMAGEFDLSVGATLGLVTSVVAVLNVNLGWPIAVAVVASLAIGGLVGALNGFFVVSVNVDGIITTLAVGTLATGVTYAITNYVTISGISNALVSITTNQIFGIPYSFFYGAVMAGIIWYVLRYMPLGQYLLFVGRSRDVARLSGLNVQRIRFRLLRRSWPAGRSRRCGPRGNRWLRRPHGRYDFPAPRVLSGLSWRYDDHAWPIQSARHARGSVLPGQRDHWAADHGPFRFGATGLLRDLIAVRRHSVGTRPASAGTSAACYMSPADSKFGRSHGPEGFIRGRTL